MSRSYQELIQIPTYLERFEYLKLEGHVGRDTFGHSRYLNQTLYRSSAWKKFRQTIIIRDKGCDLACPDYEIVGRAIIHHINPVTVQDVIDRSPKLFDPNNAILVSHITHEAIHYGDDSLLMKDPIIRKPNDTCPWR